MTLTRTKYGPLIVSTATRHSLDPLLVEALVLQESSGCTAAYRFEPAFFSKYMAANPDYQHTVPERTSASYGLMQVMFVVAVEMGFNPRNPPEMLMIPENGLEYGCKKLAKLMAWAKGDIPAALAAYNGGKKKNAPGGPLRNQRYADEVLARLAEAT